MQQFQQWQDEQATDDACVGTPLPIAATVDWRLDRILGIDDRIEVIVMNGPPL